MRNARTCKLSTGGWGSLQSQGRKLSAGKRLGADHSRFQQGFTRKSVVYQTISRCLGRTGSPVNRPTACFIREASEKVTGRTESCPQDQEQGQGSCPGLTGVLGASEEHFALIPLKQLHKKLNSPKFHELFNPGAEFTFSHKFAWDRRNAEDQQRK